MKLNTAFKLSALAVALASTSVYASTLDTSELDNDLWTDPRGSELGNIDKSQYQYVDVGTSTTTDKPETTTTDNSLTSWYTVAGHEVIKIETNKDGKKEYSFYDASELDPELIGDTLQQKTTLDNVGGGTITFGTPITYKDDAGIDQTIDTISAQKYFEILTVPESELKYMVGYDAELINAIKADYQATQGKLQSDLVPPNLGGVTSTKTDTVGNTNYIKRLDSTYLEYAERNEKVDTISTEFGNLTDTNTADPKVWLTIDTGAATKVTTEYDRGVINGIINTDKKGHLSPTDKYVKHFTNLFDENEKLTDNVYGLVASEVKTVTTNDLTNTDPNYKPTVVEAIDRYTAVTQAGVVVSDEITNNKVVITSDAISITKTPSTVTRQTPTTITTTITGEGIETSSLKVGGVDVGNALANTAVLADLTSDELDAIVNSGAAISGIEEDVTALDGRVGALETSVSDLDTTVTEEVARLDGRVDAVETSVSNLDAKVDAGLAEVNGRVDAVEETVSALDTRVTDEVARLDGRIDTELAANAKASTDYTDETAQALRDEAEIESARVDAAIDAGDKATLEAADLAAKAGDTATLEAADLAAKAGDAATLEAADLAAKAGDAATLEAADLAAKAGDAATLEAADLSAKAGDTATLNSAKAHTDASLTTAANDRAAIRSEFAAGDAATLTSANAYTDTRANQLNKRVDEVEKTAYRGVAIALAAQQNVPNIKPGQFAVFGGVGHYESESAFAMGVVGSINERTSISGAIGVAGGSEVGGRVGVAYVFGGK